MRLLQPPRRPPVRGRTDRFIRELFTPLRHLLPQFSEPGQLTRGEQPRPHREAAF